MDTGRTISVLDPWSLYGVVLTLAILKSLNTPLDFPPSMHLLLICVDLV